MRRHLPYREPAKHLALAYDAWAPVGESDGKFTEASREDWFKGLTSISIPDDYLHFYNLWTVSLSEAQTREIRLESRLLVGHGNSSAADLGLTVQHTWGVPIIPGSSLKGLCAHYVAAVYGSVDAGYKGPMWDQHRKRVCSQPGEFYRQIFGSPDIQGDPGRAGQIIFHDAVYKLEKNDRQPFARDIITPHQMEYQKNTGRWPNDFDDPNPLPFITVKPDTSFLTAVSGPTDWAKLAIELLHEAFAQWGVGAKTAAGYGRIR
jgi:CRISPR-associated protein Cmr6